MQTRRVPFFFRFFPSLTDVAFLAPLLLLFGRLDGAKTMLGDGDTGWHIRAGEWMLANGRVPDTDLFSFTKPNEAWYAWEWLSDVILGVLHQRFGLTGPVFLGIVLLGLTSVVLFRLCRRHTDNDLVAIAVTTMAVGASSIHWLARPHLFTFLFIVLTLHWMEDAYTNPKVLWRLVPLTVLWTNLHGAFFVAILFLVTAGVGIGLRVMTSMENHGWRTAWERSKTYFLVAGSCGLASLVNPYGWQLHLHIYHYLTERYHFEHISEFQTVSFHSPVAIFFEFLYLTGLLAAGWSLLRRRFVDALLLGSWMHLALIAGRNIPIYAFLAAPLVTRFLAEMLAALRDAPVAVWVGKVAAAAEGFGKEFNAMERIPRFHVTSVVAAVLLGILMLGAPAEATKLRSEYDPKKYPAGALALLDGRRVFTNDEWGDYLIYKLYPKQRVYIDGRSDFYGGEFSLRYLDALNGHWDWAEILAKHDVDAILLPTDAALASTLKETQTWKPVYDDEMVILFYRAGTSPKRPTGEQVSLGRASDRTPEMDVRYASMATKPKP